MDVKVLNELNKLKEELEGGERIMVNKNYREEVITKVERAEIYYADLTGNIGSEQGGLRPVIVIQNDAGNLHSPTTIIATITSQMKAKLPTHVEIKGCGLVKDSVVLAEQIRTIDKKRLKSFVGKVDELTMKKIDKAVEISTSKLKKKEPIDYLPRWIKQEIENKLENVYLYEDALRKAKNDDISFRNICLKEIEMYMNDLQYFCIKNNLNYKNYYKNYKVRDKKIEMTV